ncbi:L-aspartate oxidase [Halocatena pleomorpha]|uniref:L-aspartate oxidase n=1 Tax=Halocatena pleomorpha TaxID=1785090 RepID=A0A3P3RIE3_9EURY|nr:FAD-dependent oxidoreductase [Halocatena pleomorpha]RRJ33104.1 FAD-dependent oxidoreductase [Halocatena pleomorpha]
MSLSIESTTDVLVVGSGIAGCATALAAAREGAQVTLVTKATEPEDATSWWAQGGIAVTRTDPAAFKQDIRTASDDTADPEAVDVLVENARGAVENVLFETLDVSFDAADGDYEYGREAAHSERRILHVDASTGRHILGPFLSHLASLDAVTIHQDTAALDLLTHEGRVHGAYLESDSDVAPIFAGTTVLATGGIGALYPESTNPDGATGDGIAMAALAGADMRDMEYVQFHPTVCTAGEPFLVSEAVRGEGALLHNADGERFMSDYHEDAELAPRDVVARAVARERERTGTVTLDVSPLPFSETFPDLVALCDSHGVDWQSGIPVAPAEHFLCGGIAVDSDGRTSLDRLFAVGECSRTGVHGANRLASTSLLEGLVWGLRAGRAATGFDPQPIEAPDLLDRDPALPAQFGAEKSVRLHRVMAEHVGLKRTPAGLKRATAALRRLKGEVDAYTRTRTSRDLYELRGKSVTALLIARAAATNPTSTGCHYLTEESAANAD